MSRCLHGVYTYGKSLTVTETAATVLNYRRCDLCGATEYKPQTEDWAGRADTKDNT